MELNKRIVKIIIVVGLAGLVSVLGYHIYFSIKTDQQKKASQVFDEQQEVKKYKDRIEKLTEPQKKVFKEKEGYRPWAYIRPIEIEDNNGNILVGAQLRGILEKFNQNYLIVKVLDNNKKIEINNKEIKLHCLPETMPMANSDKEQSTKSVFMDLSNVKDSDSLTIAEINEQISTKDDVIVEVKLNKTGKMEIERIIGYGCDLQRELKVDL